MKKTFLTASLLLAAAFAHGEILDRPAGIRVGQRLTLMPYVSLFYTWDSNVDSSHSADGSGSSSLNVNPGFTGTYKADTWSISGGAYYQYHAYLGSNSRNLNHHSFGENLAFNWSNMEGGGPGWSVVLREDFAYISQDDDMMSDGGRGIGRDRVQLTLGGSLSRKFTDRWHGDVNASFYFLDYDNDETSYAPMFGWSRWSAGAQAGYIASKWTDFLVSGSYQGYTQQNDTDLNRYDSVKRGKNIGGYSQGWTLQAGMGSHATERISYRAMFGYSGYNYGEGAYRTGGFSYDVSGNWQMTHRWNMMLLASCYYHPSEVDYGSAQRTDQISWGLAHSMIRDKLTATLDLAYRHEQNEYNEYAESDYAENIITGRLGLNYVWNRFFSIFGRAEYQTALDTGDALYGNEYDYNRWRLSVGVRLTY